MRVRLEGSPPEIAAALEQLRQVFIVADVSRAFPARGGRDRVYVEIYHPTRRAA